MSSQWKSWVPLLVVLAALPGCVPNKLKTSESKLQDTLRRYESTVRWGQLQRIYGFLKPELSANMTLPAGLDNVRVTHYDTIAGPAPIAETRWVHSVAIEYVMQDSQVVKTLTDEQVWEQDTETGNWYRANLIPNF
jgi:hypothetical protein